MRLGAKLGIFIPLGVIGTIVLAAGGLYLAVMDTTPSPFKPQDITNEQLLQRQLVRSFKDVESSKEMLYKIDEECLNQIIFNSSKELREDEQYQGMIGDIHVEIKDNNYNFFVNVDLKAIKTRVILETVLETKDTAYEFKINKIKLGSVPLTSIVKSSGILKNIDLAKTFQDAGLTVSVDYDNMVITYLKSDMKKDLSAKISSTSTDEMIQSAMDAIEFEFGFDSGLYARGNFSNLIENPSKSDSRSNSSHYANYAARKALVTEQAKEVAAMYGKNGNTETSVQQAANERFARLQNLATEGDDANTIIKDRMMETEWYSYVLDTTFNGEVAYVTEEEIDSILGKTEVLGKNYLLHYENELVYVVVDSFYCDMFTSGTNSYINFTMGINLNGLETRAIIETKATPKNNSFACDFTIENIYYGSTPAPDGFTTMVKNFLEDGVNSMEDHTWFEYHKADNKFTIDFDKMLKTDIGLAPYYNVFDTLGIGRRDFHIDKEKVGLNGNGKLSLWFDRTYSS